MTDQQRKYIQDKLKQAGVKVRFSQVHIDSIDLASRVLERLRSRPFEAVATDGKLDNTSRLPYDPGELILTNDLVTFSELIPDYKGMNYRTPEKVEGFYLVDPQDISRINQEIEAGHLDKISALKELDKVAARITLKS